LVTGVKRNIKLLERVKAAPGDIVNVLDVSLDKNRVELERVLSEGAEVFYCDHHFAGEQPEHVKLTTLINTASDVCTSLLINQKLENRYLEWAVAGTFGDNLKKAATGMAKSLNINAEELSQLEKLGIYLNYNGYGAALEDLYFDPAELFKRTSRHASAFGFMHDDRHTFEALETGYHEDMAKAGGVTPAYEQDHVAIFILPNKPWARRVAGVYGNELANLNPSRAHAVLTARPDGDFLVSIRAPLDNKKGADQICRMFPTGGGRAAAAGINQLPADMYDEFAKIFEEYYSG